MKKVLVTGSSGYVANYIIKQLARTRPELAIVGLSRSAKARDEEVKQFKNVSFVKGNCLDANTFRDYLEDVDGVVHTVGTLIEKKGHPTLSYVAMNKDAAVNVVGELQDWAWKQKTTKTFVYLSSEKAPPFLDDYLKTKIEAEQYILSAECENIRPTILRPGFIYDRSHRWWSLPLKIGVDIGYLLNEKIYKQTPFAKQIDFLFPAKSVKLSTVSHFAIEGLEGKLTEKIITNSQMIDYESRT
jgi:nucleoside-diphosphate-sugar epimerase